MMNKSDILIVGGGIAGLSALHFLKNARPSLSVKLLEADSRLGGTIGTDKINGYSFDWGPNGFLDREPLTLQMIEQLGLNTNLERANEKVSNRYILRNGKLRLVPMSPPKFLTSDILPFKGKLRVMMELFGKSKPDTDESIYDFVKRRIGRDAADYLVQPMVSGIYGGMADRLSLQSCFPIMSEMEDEYGSLFKAMIGKARQAKKAGKKSGGPAGPGGWLTSFNGGLYRIIEEFASQYKNDITLSSPVSKISQNESGYNVEIENGSTATASHIILALPTYRAVDMVRQLSEALSKSFASIQYAPISVVCLGFKKEQVTHDLEGFGFLVPKKENKNILGSIWTSSIFANRAPDGSVQFRTMLGGDGDHDSINLNDDELLRITISDMNDIVGITGQPEQVKIYRWAQGIPQFKIGHAKIMEAIESELIKIGNIHITGNAFYGIGLNDCIKQSYKVAQKIIR